MTTLLALCALLSTGALRTWPVLQGKGPSVGDTIWVRRTVSVPAGHTVRAGDWEPADPVQLLGRARVVVTGDTAQIAYPVVVWRPGQHTVELPAPLLLGPDGTVDSLRSERVRLDVTSVLQPVRGDSALRPQPRAALVGRRVVSPAPVALLWLAALMLLLPIHLWWRRRGKPTRAVTAPLPTGALEPPLARWADAGEHRAVANVATAQLRATLAQRVPAAHAGLDTARVIAELAAAQPEWPLEEMGNLLHALDGVRFGSTPSSAALALSRSGQALRDRLPRDAA